MKKNIKKVVSSFMLMLMLIPTFMVYPNVKAYNNDMENAKQNLIETANSLRPALKLAAVDIEEWARKYNELIIPALNLNYINNISTFLEEMDIEGIFDLTINLFDEDTPVRNELIAIKVNHADTISGSLNLMDDAMVFLETYKSEITIDNAISVIDKLLLITDNYITLIKTTIEQLNSKLPLGFYDIFLLEYEDQIYGMINDVNNILARLENSFLVRVSNLLKSNSVSLEEKVAKHSKYLESIKRYREKGIEYYDTLITAFDSEIFTSFMDNIKDFYLDVVDYDVAYVTKLLIDNININDLNDQLSEEEINEYIESVYGVKPVDESLIHYNGATRILTTNSLSLNENNIINFLETQFGTINLTNLADGRVKTGTIIEVVEDGVVKNSYVMIVKGDTLGRGIVDITNIIHIVDVVLGSNSLNEIYSLAGDLNNDNNIDISDIIRLIDKILG